MITRGRKDSAMDVAKLVLSLATEYYKWDCYVDGKCRISAHPFFLTEEDYRTIQDIALPFNELIKHTIQIVLEDPRWMRFFGFSKFERRLFAAERRFPDRCKSHIARLDFFRTYDGAWKIAEFN